MDRKILVVDNDRLMRSIVLRTLEDKYKVLSAATGEESVAMLEACRPDLVLMDVGLTGIDGYEAMRQMHAVPGFEKLPVIMMTGLSDTDSEVRSLEAGAVDYVRKPITPGVLMTRIDKALDQVETRKNLEHYAEIDTLTGLLNRRAGRERIEKALEDRTICGALLILDLDRFKAVNDTYGHSCGDRILQRFAGILHSFTRNDDVVFRFGGDEFVIFYRGYSDLSSLAERCRRIIAKAEFVLNDMLDEKLGSALSVSIGIAIIPQDGADFDSLIANADKALYHVKQNGRRGFYFYESTCNSVHDAEEDDRAIDILQLRRMVAEAGGDMGAYRVDYDDFKKIYRFLMRYTERSQTGVQLVLMTLVPEGDELNVIDAERHLGRIIAETLRRGDVTAQYGPNQFMILLMDTNTDNGKIAADRVIRNWEKEKQWMNYRVKYEIQGIAV